MRNSTSDGSVYPEGQAANAGSMKGRELNAPIVGMADMGPEPGGYWLAAADGGVFSFGCQPMFSGSMGGQHLNAPIVGIASTGGDGSYYLAGADGGVFSFGPGARFYGSLGKQHLSSPIVGIAADGGSGYLLVSARGDVYAFGPGASNQGSPAAISAPIVGIALTETPCQSGQGGYWLVGSDGNVYSFGNASNEGSEVGQRLSSPIVGMAVEAVTGGSCIPAGST